MEDGHVSTSCLLLQHSAYRTIYWHGRSYLQRVLVGTLLGTTFVSALSHHRAYSAPISPALSPQSALYLEADAPQSFGEATLTTQGCLAAEGSQKPCGEELQQSGAPAAPCELRSKLLISSLVSSPAISALHCRIQDFWPWLLWRFIRL